jgi:hypothetical protein
MSILLMFFTALATASGAARQGESAALRQTAPTYLTTDAMAAQHLAASTLAGELISVDPTLLLAIAWRESRYTLGVTGPPVRGKRACGLMQPMMHSETCREQTVLEGYLEGASHLRTWLDTKTCRGDLRCALLGYAGGYALINGCAAGPVVVERNGKRADFCKFIPESITAHAKRIQFQLQRGAAS